MRIRYWLLVALAAGVLGTTIPAANAQGIFGKLKDKVKDKVNEKEDNAANGAVNAADPTNKNGSSNSSSNPSPSANAATPANPAAEPSGAEAGGSAASAAAPVTLLSYQNYDFTPGKTIIFADDFADAQDGEFPSQWELLKGQAVVNKTQGYQAFLLTDGNYAGVAPRMKTKDYLGPDFTVEYDTYFENDVYALQVIFHDDKDDTEAAYVDHGNAGVSGNASSFSGMLPPAIRDAAFVNKWHHVAMVYRKPQIKIYVDQYRVLSVPDLKFEPLRLTFEGVGDQQKPIIFRNVRIADGGGMNMIGKKFTDAKIVTHGINFDVDKATLRPESMGTLNQIKAVMDQDPTLKFEIDGHTDNTGEAAHNMTLSQERADAVKAQLVTMGISADRLTTKGFGDTKPMATNDTPDGKANNRRVEFVRTSS